MGTRDRMKLCGIPSGIAHTQKRPGQADSTETISLLVDHIYSFYSHDQSPDTYMSKDMKIKKNEGQQYTNVKMSGSLARRAVACLDGEMKTRSRLPTS